jgi:hypothetical protein
VGRHRRAAAAVVEGADDPARTLANTTHLGAEVVSASAG